jgi:hypothetical protein
MQVDQSITCVTLDRMRLRLKRNGQAPSTGNSGNSKPALTPLRDLLGRGAGTFGAVEHCPPELAGDTRSWVRLR